MRRDIRVEKKCFRLMRHVCRVHITFVVFVEYWAFFSFTERALFSTSLAILI